MERKSPFPARPYSRYRRSEPPAAQDAPEITLRQFIWLLVLHAPLVFIFQAAPIVGRLHSLVALAAGFYVVSKDSTPARSAWVIAYIVASEVLWRGTGAAIFWEYSKYSVLILSVLMMFKFRLFGKMSALPLLFLALLVPGVFLAENLSRQTLAFQLSGLVTMAIASMTFSAMQFEKKDLQRFFLALIVPNISLAALIAYNLATQDLSFSSGSNNAVSSGIGANQVSSALSLSATAAFYSVFLLRKQAALRNLMIAVAVGMISASVLTFSRAGLWNAGGALAAGALFLIRDNRQRGRALAAFITMSLLGYFFIFPALNNFTGGALEERFSSLDTTGRDVIFQIDYHLFTKNPVFGVGVGQSLKYHPVDGFGFVKETHTEYGRLLAEHGSLGIAIILILILTPAFRALFSKQNFLTKSISASFSAWALLYMTHAATRMAAPAFAFGLAAANFSTEEEPDKQDTQPIRKTPRFRRI
ncbi:MAG: O-antigen ligase family protein [Anaerolineales bacterium]